MDSIEQSTLVSLDLTRNRSLTPLGRRCVLALVAVTAFAVAGIAAAYGAWPALPFAGLEVLGLAWAFRVVEAHDGDYERFVVTGDLVIVESSRRGTVARLTFNREWARLVCVVQGRRCRLAVRSHGKEFPFGRLMSDADRMEWAQTVRGAIRVVNG
jgi:uncharacterized membrane protein